MKKINFLLIICLSLVLLASCTAPVTTLTPVPSVVTPETPAATASLPPQQTSAIPNTPVSGSPSIPLMAKYGITALESDLGIHTTTAVGEQKVIVIMANFPDVTPAITKEAVYNTVFVDLDEYFRDVSYGKIWLSGNITGPYTLPNPLADYNTAEQNIYADKTCHLAMVQNAVDAADGDVDFSRYSYVIVVLGAPYRLYTPVCFCALPGMLNAIGVEQVITKSGQTINNAAVFSEDCYLGSFVHDTIHMFGGRIGNSRVTPCLYDQDIASFVEAKIHIGNWDPLSGHVYKFRFPPPGLVAWTKMRLNWIEPSRIAMVSLGQTVTVPLDPLDSADSATLVIKIPLTSDTFYLVENHQRVGYDQNSPSSGILISYADDRYLGECRHGQAPVQLMNANPDVPYLEGAAFDIGQKEIFVDTRYNLAIILLRKVDLSYEIQITTADKVDTASGNCVFPTFPEGFQRTE
jgi:hypothetical protein